MDEVTRTEEEMEGAMDGLLDDQAGLSEVRESMATIRRKYDDIFEHLNAETKKLAADIEAEMAEAGLLKREAHYLISIAGAKENLAENWVHPKKVVEREAGTFTRKTTRTAVIMEPLDLLGKAIGMPVPPLKLDKIPWDKRALLTLHDGGALDDDLVTVAESHHIAIGKPKAPKE